MVPSLDDMQQAINRMIQLILDVSRGVSQWGQKHLLKSNLKTGLLSAPRVGKSAKKEESKLIYFDFLINSSLNLNENAIFLL